MHADHIGDGDTIVALHRAGGDRAETGRGQASGKKLVVLHRTIKNQRLAAVGYFWTFALYVCNGRSGPL